MINSKEYWDDLYSQDKQNIQREKQTEFFINLVLANLPKWLVEDIQDESMTIGDVGCAEGIGTELIAKQFSASKVTGIDFAPKAVEEAKHRHPSCQYEVGNIKSLENEYDVIFSSNVLEHFWHSTDVLEKMIIHAKKYCILLLPFREYYTMPEHASYFDFQSFPLEIQDKYQLCFYKPITMQGDEVQYWFGEQIIVVYGKKEYVRRKNLTLKNLYNGYVEERTALIQRYDEKIKQYETKETTCDKKVGEIEGKLCKLEEEVSNKQKLIYEKERELEKYKDIVSDMSIDNSAVREAIGAINETQSSRVYKVSLAFRKFYVQCVANREGKEFFKWLVAKFLRKKYLGENLKHFDYLENAKNKLIGVTNTNVHLLNESETTHCYKKRKDLCNTVFIFASVPFYDVGGGQRSAQLAKTFNDLGYIVHYIYGFECSEENVPDMFIPTVTHSQIDAVDLKWFERNLSKESIVIFEIPYYKFAPYLEMAHRYGQHTVYEHIDNWDSNLGSMFYDETIFKEFLKSVDLVTVTARMLGEKIREVSERKVLYLPNAVNISIFEPSKAYECPKDLIRGKQKTLLYFGSLWGEWFDWEKVLYVARECKDVTINLIGDYSGIQDKIGSFPQNIVFLGLKKQTDLPAYLKYADIAIIPFKNCEIGKYVSPLKIFEYIAMNKKVVATTLDDIQNYPNVYASDDKEKWVEYIDREDSVSDVEEFIAKNNWYARCHEIIENFRMEKDRASSKISVVVLNYNNKNVVDRCIKTLQMHNVRYHYEIIVVDNGSTDGSYELLEEKYGSDIKLVKNGVNGCSSGRNLGVKNAEGEYILFLDSDQWIVSDYWLDSPLDLLENNVSIGAVAWNAGWFEPGKTYGPIVDYAPNRAIDGADIWFRTDIAYLATSGFLMKKELFIQVGGFDEFYDPTCFEDTDISLKIRNEGYELAYCPYMSIMHLPHQTTLSGSKKHAQLMKRNGEYFWKKWKETNGKLLEYYKK